ncbi:DTW domain-containing protein [Enterovibrio norvegicus]|uniref:tRNA-uridine aminocarboxypropyltransferase n=1 Tax=Enterovibrio norvegicus TaxID=188144 RepID=UPI000300A8E9|nr:tRNA-uridine aminocarboxypropyltransferase [Enterovibrio norvegicus]OEE51631.1 DTW domain-containing protein [Enterovibrio norvegicus]PMI27508.1 DTW domain-containing protein [Enterovibrio norvegicus]PMI36381.1 DTW domain-containing protein [Enterovibrio norvegicus]PMN51331.1 DTW domain-containing protein [Enterovibrio norvegicus]TKF13436.1 DTW domain-containing protein [Enterovibrio norvegicus]
MKLHAIHRLYDERLAQSTKPFRARGASVERCRHCMVNAHLCICAHNVRRASHAGFLLVMYDDEVLKPSNTGRLIADAVEDTYAYIWSRTSPNEEMLALIKDPMWQPFVIFPEQYSTPERVVNIPVVSQGKRPLFILIDGTWSEAKKIFRKSPWMDSLPVLSIKADDASRYKMREACGEGQLATAEVAAKVLALAGDLKAADCLDAWFDVFKEHYLTGKKQRQLPIPGALDRYKDVVARCEVA